MSMIIQTLRANDSIPSSFRDDSGARLDNACRFCLDEGEEISETVNFHQFFQTSRMTTGSPKLGQDSFCIHNWDFSFTQKRVLIWSPNARHQLGAAANISGLATGGYLRYSDIAGLSAVNYTDGRDQEGRVEICSRGNTEKSGVEIFTIIGSGSAETLRGFARTLTEKMLAYWQGRETDAEEFETLLKEFAALDWQSAIREKDYLKGLGVYKDEEGKAWARWREALPLPPSGIDALKRQAFELREDVKGLGNFLIGNKYEKKSYGQFRGED
ncbi:MAG: hypothetical protein LBS91_01280 [Clostridiales Family XIII bacterium]|jgi:hypothetical protein|nr:hypothetical protein [Clostridiales Family XIII bacterium]